MNFTVKKASKKSDAFFCRVQERTERTSFEEIIKSSLPPDNEYGWQNFAEKIMRVYEEFLREKVLLSATVRAALQNLQKQTPKINFLLNSLPNAGNRTKTIS